MAESFDLDAIESRATEVARIIEQNDWLDKYTLENHYQPALVASQHDVAALVARVRDLEAAVVRFREHCEYGNRTLIANSKSTSDNPRLALRFEAKATGLRLALSYLDDEREILGGTR